MDVRMPDGTLIRNVPEGTTKAQLQAKLDARNAPQAAPSAPRLIEQRAQTSGYDLARSNADAMNESRKPNMTDTLVAPFAGELAGAAGYVSQGAQNLYRGATGQPVGPSAADAYRAERDSYDVALGQYEEENPGLSTAGRVMGSMALSPSATNLSRIPQFFANVGTGGLLGGIYGAAEADPGSRVEGGLWGAGIGAAATPAVQLLSKPVAAVGRAISRSVQPVNRALVPQGVRNSTARNAADYVSDILTGTGRSVNDIAAVQTAGKPLTGAEAIGRPGISHLSALGKRSGSAADALEDTMRLRSEQAPERILGDISGTTGVNPSSASGDIEKIVSSLRSQAAPLYRDAFSQPTPLTPELRSLMNRPTVKDAMRSASGRIRDMGKDPALLGLEFDSLGNISVRTEPTTEAWDIIKRELDGLISSNIDEAASRLSGRAIMKNPSLGSSLNSLSQELKDAIFAANPSYQRAVSAAGEYLGVSSAFGAGKSGIFGTEPAEAFARTFSRLGNAEREAAKAGIANGIYSLSQRGLLRPARLKQPQVIAKLRTAFGDNATDELIRRVDMEATLAANANRMRPGTGSQTADQIAAMREQDVAGDALEAGAGAVIDLATGGPMAALANMARRAPGYIGDMARTGGMGRMTRDEAARILMLPPDQLAAYLRSVGSPLAPRGALPSAISGAIGGAAAN